LLSLNGFAGFSAATSFLISARMAVDVYITKLRKLLQDDPTIKIINVHGKGYKLSTRENDN
jgi:DNA-binding response OmpR family regulator